MSKTRRSFEFTVTGLSLCASLPLLLLLLWVEVYAKVSIWLILLSALIFTLLILYISLEIYRRVESQFRRLENVLSSMVTGDYSLRARSDQPAGALDELVKSINGLAERLSQQRTESVENRLLLETVIQCIDVAIIAVDAQHRISFLNPAAEQLISQSELEKAVVVQHLFQQLKMADSDQVIRLALGKQERKYKVHIEAFRQAGKQHQLLFFTDISNLLRSEERRAWQSLVRVISHEINNSLTPIVSISKTLQRLATQRDTPCDNQQDLIDHLKIISNRAESLKRFIESYKQLTRLPEPQKEWVPLPSLLAKVQPLFAQHSIQLTGCDSLQVLIDLPQFEQVLINLLKNAIEATGNHTVQQAEISIEWGRREQSKISFLTITDNGGGVSNPDNLFVPFYTTKKQGSGIGLLLCRQIVEAHGGRLSIANREHNTGCCVTIELFDEERV